MRNNVTLLPLFYAMIIHHLRYLRTPLGDRFFLPPRWGWVEKNLPGNQLGAGDTNQGGNQAPYIHDPSICIWFHKNTIFYLLFYILCFILFYIVFYIIFYFTKAQGSLGLSRARRAPLPFAELHLGGQPKVSDLDVLTHTRAGPTRGLEGVKGTRGGRNLSRLMEGEIMFKTD